MGNGSKSESDPFPTAPGDPRVESWTALVEALLKMMVMATVQECHMTRTSHYKEWSDLFEICITHAHISLDQLLKISKETSKQKMLATKINLS